MSESKECHASNNDILRNCLKIINAGGTTKKNTNRASSHACIAYSDSLERKLLKNELKEVWE